MNINFIISAIETIASDSSEEEKIMAANSLVDNLTKEVNERLAREENQEDVFPIGRNTVSSILLATRNG